MSASPDIWPQLPPSRSPANAVAAPLGRPLAGDGLIETDGELLRLFTRHGDAAAFDKLVERHAAMVWRVCRQTLRRQQDAEDAFQATFLLLVKGARQIGASESAAGWLFRVAYRTSLRARKRLASRREEALALDPTAPSEEQFPDLTARQHLGVLAEELMELPLRYQTPLVMRYVEGQSRRAIAEATDVTVATVQGRLARGKQLLRRRLVRRGVSLAVAISAVSTPKAQAARAAEAAASTQLVLQTTTNATALATGGSLAASAVVAALLEQGTRAMLFASLTKPMAAAAACGLAALVLAAPPAESTSVVSEGVVLSAALVDDAEGEPAEAPAATLQLAANEPTSDREPEASAPGAAAGNDPAVKFQQVYFAEDLVSALSKENPEKDVQSHLKALAAALANTVKVEANAIKPYAEKQALIIAADRATHKRLADRLQTMRATQDIRDSLAQAFDKGEPGASAPGGEAQQRSEPTTASFYVNDLMEGDRNRDDATLSEIASEITKTHGIQPAQIQIDKDDQTITVVATKQQIRAVTNHIDALVLAKKSEAVARAKSRVDALAEKIRSHLISVASDDPNGEAKKLQAALELVLTAKRELEAKLQDESHNLKPLYDIVTAAPNQIQSDRRDGEKLRGDDSLGDGVYPILREFLADYTGGKPLEVESDVVAAESRSSAPGVAATSETPAVTATLQQGDPSLDLRFGDMALNGRKLTDAEQGEVLRKQWAEAAKKDPPPADGDPSFKELHTWHTYWEKRYDALRQQAEEMRIHRELGEGTATEGDIRLIAADIFKARAEALRYERELKLRALKDGEPGASATGGEAQVGGGGEKSLEDLTKSEPSPAETQDWNQRLSRLPGFEGRKIGRGDLDGNPVSDAQHEAAIAERWRQRAATLPDVDVGSPTWEEQEASYQSAKQRYDYLEKLLSYKLQRRAAEKNQLTPEQWTEIEIEVDGLTADHAAAKKEALKQERELLARALQEGEPGASATGGEAASDATTADNESAPKEPEPTVEELLDQARAHVRKLAVVAKEAAKVRELVYQQGSAAPPHLVLGVYPKAGEQIQQNASRVIQRARKLLEAEMERQLARIESDGVEDASEFAQRLAEIQADFGARTTDLARLNSLAGLVGGSITMPSLHDSQFPDFDIKRFNPETLTTDPPTGEKVPRSRGGMSKGEPGASATVREAATSNQSQQLSAEDYFKAPPLFTPRTSEPTPPTEASSPSVLRSPTVTAAAPDTALTTMTIPDGRRVVATASPDPAAPGSEVLLDLRVEPESAKEPPQQGEPGASATGGEAASARAEEPAEKEIRRDAPAMPPEEVLGLSPPLVAAADELEMLREQNLQFRQDLESMRQRLDQSSRQFGKVVDWPQATNSTPAPPSAEALEKDPFGPRLSKEDAKAAAEQLMAGASKSQAAAAAVMLREQIAAVERGQAALRDQAQTDAGIRQMVDQFDDVKAQMREQLDRFDPRVGAEELRSLTLPARQPAASTPTSTPLLPLDTSGASGSYAAANERYSYSVQQLQQRLNEVLETSSKLDVDGDYGPQTVAAVRQFQSKQGLKPTGFADEETRAALGFIETASPPKGGVEALSSEIDKNLDEAEEALLKLIAIAQRAAEVRKSAAESRNSRIGSVAQDAIRKAAQEHYNTVTQRTNAAKSHIKRATEEAVFVDLDGSSADPSSLVKSLARFNEPLKRITLLQVYALQASTSLQDPKAAPWLETFDLEKLRAGLMPPRPQASEAGQERGRPPAPKSPPPAPPLPDKELSVDQLKQLQTELDRQRNVLANIVQSEGKLAAFQAELESKNLRSAEAKTFADLTKAHAEIDSRLRQARLLEAERFAAEARAALESVKPSPPPANDGSTQSILKQPDAPQAPPAPESPKADAPPPPADDASQRSSSKNHLKEMMLALLNFHDQKFHFPGVVEGGLSWRVQLLPLLGYEGLYKEFHHDEPWDSPHNLPLLKKMPDVFRDPRSQLPADSGKTNYVAAGGPGAFMELGEARRFTDIRDGTARTIALIEVGDEHAVEWTRPVDFDTEAHADDPRRGIGTLGPGGVITAFVDGSIQQLGEDVSSEALREMLLIDDASAKLSGSAGPSTYGGIALEPPKPDGSRIAYAARNKEYGWSVLQLQERLNEVLKPTPPLRVDGDYGPQTVAAVEQFQRDRELPVTGFADASTRTALGFVEPSEPQVSTPEPANDGKPASEAEPTTDGEPEASATGGEAERKTASATAPELRADVTEWFAQFKKKDASFKLTDEQILEVRTLLELDDPTMSEEKRLGREAGFALALGMPQFQNGSPSQCIKAATWFALQDSVNVELKR